MKNDSTNKPHYPSDDLKHHKPQPTSYRDRSRSRSPPPPPKRRWGQSKVDPNPTTINPIPNPIALSTHSNPNEPKPRLYVGAIDYGINENDIQNLFAAFGTILNVDMPRDIILGGSPNQLGRHKGYCFVDFQNTQEAAMALKGMQGFLLRSRPLKVGTPSVSANAQQPVKTLASIEVDPIELSSAIAKATYYANTTLSADGAFGHQGPQQQSLSDIGGETTSGAPAAGSNNRIYVGNVPYSYSRHDIAELFKGCGTVLSCHLQPSTEHPGTHRGFGFVAFSTAEEAATAVQTMNGLAIQGDRKLKVNFAASGVKSSHQNNTGGQMGSRRTGDSNETPVPAALMPPNSKCHY